MSAHDAETLAEVLTDYQLFEAVALWLCESFEDEDGIGCEPEAGPPCLGHVTEASDRVTATLAARIVQARAGEGALPYDDRLITCPECRSTFEAEDGTVVHQTAAGEGALRERVIAAACGCGGDAVRHTVGADRRCPVHGYGTTVEWRFIRAALAETDRP